MIIKGVKPKWMENYRPGYIGFTHRSTSTTGKGISWFTRRDRLSEIRAGHCFVVSAEDEAIEARFEGVTAHPIQERFDDPRCQVFFRKPRGYTDELGWRIVHAASLQVGCPYDFALMAAHAVSGSFLGRLLNKGMPLEDLVCDMADRADRWLCSELVAHALDQQPEFHDKGVLEQEDHCINPQELFEDDVIFEEWENE